MVKRYRRKLKKRFIKKGARKYKVPRYTNVSKVIGFPESMLTKLVYQQSTSTTALTFSNVFRGNSVFDPDFTGAGNQPNYFDTYASLYAKYRVVASKIECRIVNGSSTVPIRWSIMPSDSSTILTNVANASGNPMCKTGICTLASGSRSICTVKSYCTTARINGKTKAQINGSDQYESLVSTNPADAWFWIFQCEDLSIASNMAVIIDFKLTYYVRFTDKFNQNLS